MKLKKLTRLAGFLALSVVIGYLETLIPIFNGTVPGLKLGFANIIILVILYEYGYKDALLVSLLRVFLLGLIITGLFSIPFFFSLTGACFSFAFMSLAKKFTKLSIIGVSVLGSLAHSLGQILAAVFFLEMPSLFYYLPWLLAFSIPTGILVGMGAKYFVNLFEKRLKNVLE